MTELKQPEQTKQDEQVEQLKRLKQRTNKVALYVLLVFCSAIFMVPLLWVIATSLKPVEQTMTIPPSWIPYAYRAEIDGEIIEVRKCGEIGQDGYLVELTEGPRKGERLIVPLTTSHSEAEPKNLVSSSVIASEAKQSQASNTSLFAPGAQIKVPVTIQVSDRHLTEYYSARIIKQVKHDWIKVIERPDEEYPGALLRWSCAPEEEIKKAIRPRWRNYAQVFKKIPFGKYALNTLIVCILGVIGTMFSNALVAYGFARIKWRGRNTFFVITLATMMIPFPVTMIPLYTIFRNLGWVGSLKPLWVPYFFGSAFNIFLLRQFFLTVPQALSDAARIDGCNEFGIFWRIFLPLCRPALVVIGLFHFLYAWNDLMGPLIYLTSQDKYTLALGLQVFQSQHGGTEWHLLMAASAMVILPVLILFFFTQRTFIEGIALSGLKE
jgi:multiple sugar transport system permease protein